MINTKNRRFIKMVLMNIFPTGIFPLMNPASTGKGEKAIKAIFNLKFSKMKNAIIADIIPTRISHKIDLFFVFIIMDFIYFINIQS